MSTPVRYDSSVRPTSAGDALPTWTQRREQAAPHLRASATVLSVVWLVLPFFAFLLYFSVYKDLSIVRGAVQSP